MCKQTGLGDDDLEVMTIGACLDYFDEYVKRKNPDNQEQEKARQATQEDFDNF